MRKYAPTIVIAIISGLIVSAMISCVRQIEGPRDNIVVKEGDD